MNTNRIEKVKRLRAIAYDNGDRTNVLRADILIRKLLSSMAERANQRFVNQQGQSCVTYIR